MTQPQAEAFGTVAVVMCFVAMIWFARKSPAPLGLPFLSANLFKAWLMEHVALFKTVDYTVVTSILVLAAAIWSALRRPAFSVPIPWGYWFLFLCLAAALLVATPMDAGWAVREYLQFTGFGLVAVVAPVFLFRFERDLAAFWQAFLFTTVVVDVTTIVLPANPATNRSVFVGGPDSISHARFFAMAILVVVTGWPRLPWEGMWLNRVLAILMVGLFFAGILYSGSRGPFLHLLASLAVVILVGDLAARWKLATLLGGLILAPSIWMMFPESPVLERITGLTDFEALGTDYSIGYRFDAWNYVLETWTQGFFWGQGLGVIEMRHGIQPHSIMLDILYSGGFVSIVLFLAMIVRSFALWWARPKTLGATRASPHYSPAFALGVFGVITASTGYESTGTRYVLFLFTILIAACFIWRRSATTEARAKTGPTDASPREDRMGHGQSGWPPLRVGPGDNHQSVPRESSPAVDREHSFCYKEVE